MLRNQQMGLRNNMSGNATYQYLSVKEVAKLLGFHPETVKRWARDGKIEVQQAGHYGQIRVKWPLQKPGRSLNYHKVL
jgi:excisionase family DNA binding protein